MAVAQKDGKAAGGSGLTAGSLVVVAGPFNSRHNALRFWMSANQTFKLLLEISDDEGVTWYTAQEFASAVVTDSAATGYVNGGNIQQVVPQYWQVAVKNTGGGDMAYKWDFRVYDQLDLGG